MTDTSLVKTGGVQVPEMTNKIIALMKAADELGKWIAVTRKMSSMEPGKLVAMKCLTEGLLPDEFFEKYHVLGTGQIVLTANASLGKFKSLGGKYKIIRNDEEACEIEFEWKKEKKVQSFTIEQARKKGLIKAQSAWATWPEDQLMWTVVRKYLRRYVPEEFAGSWNPDGTQEEDIVDYTSTAPTVPEAATVVVPDTVLPPPPPEEKAPAGGGLDTNGNLLDPPEEGEVAEAEANPVQDLVDSLKAYKVPLVDAVSFLVNVPHWLPPDVMRSGSPVRAAFDKLKQNHVDAITVQWDEFVEKVRKYAEIKDTPPAGVDAGDAVQPPADGPAPEKPAVAAGSITAPAPKRKRGRPPKAEPAPSDESEEPTDVSDVDDRPF